MINVFVIKVPYDSYLEHFCNDSKDIGECLATLNGKLISANTSKIDSNIDNINTLMGDVGGLQNTVSDNKKRSSDNSTNISRNTFDIQQMNKLISKNTDSINEFIQIKKDFEDQFND